MIELFRSTKDRQYYFRIRAKNGKIIAQSEGYKNMRAALNGCAALIKVVDQAKGIHEVPDKDHGG